MSRFLLSTGRSYSWRASSLPMVAGTTLRLPRHLHHHHPPPTQKTAVGRPVSYNQLPPAAGRPLSNQHLPPPPPAIAVCRTVREIRPPPIVDRAVRDKCQQRHSKWRTCCSQTASSWMTPPTPLTRR